MHDPLAEAHALFSKLSTLIVGLIVGIIGKVSYDIAMRRKLTFLQWMGIVGMSIFVGYVTWLWCENAGFKEQMGYIIPVSTLLGEKILVYVTVNANIIFQKILSIFTKK